MAETGKTPQIFVAQIRERADVAQHEQDCIVERTGLPAESLDCVNLVMEQFPEWERISKADCVIIGGSGLHSVTMEHAFSAALRDAVCRLQDEGKPMLGACWGHQFIAATLGGETITDKARGETGVNEIELTDAGVADPLFAGLPRTFVAAMGHNDRVSVLPRDGIELAISQVCGNQAFRIGTSATYGSQFHTELSAQRLVERLEIYGEVYDRGDGGIDRLREELPPTPIADGIMRRWLELYVL